MKNKNMFNLTSLSLLTSLLLFSGCGSSSNSGGSSDNQNNNSTSSVSGQVIDPAIKGALVKICSKSDLTDCLQYNTATTDENGSFSITGIDSNLNMNNYIIIANGGEDSETGEDFEDLNLSIPASYSSTNSIIVSPITSLLYENNWDQSTLASNLGLSESEVLLNPTNSKKLQKTALLLTKIAKNRSNGFKNFNITDGNLTSFVNNDTSLSSDIRNELTTTIEFLEEDSSDTTEDIITNYTSLKVVFESDTYQDANKSDEDVFTNAKKWAAEIHQELDDNNITKPNTTQINAVFKQTPTIDLTDNNLSIDINASSLNLKDMLPKGEIYNHKIALSKGLGVDASIDGSVIRNYYYNSTASSLHQIEELISSINDISITDSIYTDIAKAYAKNGEIDKAIAYAKSDIFFKQNKAEVYRTAADNLVSTDTTTAKEYIDKAFELYKSVTEAKGTGNMDKNDIYYYKYLLMTYTKISDTSGADSVKNYINTKLNEFTNVTQFSSFAAGLETVMEELIKNGETSQAITTANETYEYAKKMVANEGTSYCTGKNHYKAKVKTYVDVVEKLIQLGENSKAIEILDAAQALRLNDGFSNDETVTYRGENIAGYCDTQYQTRSYASNMVRYYILAGEKTKANNVIPTALDSDYITQGYINYATGLALINSDLTESFSIVDDNVSGYSLYTDNGAKMMALTHNGFNKNTGYISQVLIEKNEMAKAKLAIDKALTFLDQSVAAGERSSSNSLKSLHYIKFGYSKLANIYSIIGESSTSDTLFDKAIAISDGTYDNANTSIVITDDRYKVDALEQIEAHLYEINKQDKAALVVEKAYEIAKNRDTTKNKLYSLDEIFDVEGKYSTIANVVSEMENLIDNSNGDIGESTTDRNNKKIVDYLVVMANASNKNNNLDKAKTLLTKALTYTSSIIKDSDKISKKQKIAEAYASYNLMEEAQKVIASVKFTNSRREIIAGVAQELYNFDAFPDHTIAVVDTDRDGKPDFFSYGTTRDQIDASNLTLDNDSDGDNIEDSDDTTPFYSNN